MELNGAHKEEEKTQQEIENKVVKPTDNVSIFHLAQTLESNFNERF